jgi:hypothetical protein
MWKLVSIHHNRIATKTIFLPQMLVEAAFVGNGTVSSGMKSPLLSPLRGREVRALLTPHLVQRDKLSISRPPEPT